MDLFPFITKSMEKTAFRTCELPEDLLPVFLGDKLFIKQDLLKKIPEEAFRDMAFYFRENHLDLLGNKLLDTEIDENEKFVIESILKNAIISSDGILPHCQDTGTAIIYAWKNEGIYTGFDDRKALESGAEAAYRKYGLRYSQIAASSFFDEFNTENNLPAHIRIEAVSGNTSVNGPAYHFLFIAKGGGSTNKTAYFSSTPALLQKEAFTAFLEEKIRAIGTAGCPPYRLAVVAGGASAEQNLEILKLATSEALDEVPYFNQEKQPGLFRDRDLERQIMEIGERTGFGAQFGGKSFILDARVLRLPRHAATFPVSIGISCIAHRSIYAYVDQKGLHIEKLVKDPKDFFDKKFSNAKNINLDVNINTKTLPDNISGNVSPQYINLDKPIRDVCGDLSGLSLGAIIYISGKLIVARDLAHLKWHGLLSEGKDLPEYVRNHPVYYAGPAGTPEGRIIGSLGPTSALRMDPYGDELMSRGYSLISLAKGNRTQLWKDACKKYGGFFLGSIGGAAALLANYVTSNELVDYPELGMEAVRIISVKDFPAFIVIDDKGNDLFN